MEALDMLKVIGKTASLSLDGMRVNVTVLNAKTSYGSVRFQVSPVSGTGMVWVDSSRVQFDTQEWFGE